MLQFLCKNNAVNFFPMFLQFSFNMYLIMLVIAIQNPQLVGDKLLLSHNQQSIGNLILSILTKMHLPYRCSVPLQSMD